MPKDVNALRSILVTAIINPLLVLLFALALLVFAWGVLQFMMGAANDTRQKDEGKRHMFWGIIGFVIMTGAVAIIQIAVGIFGQPFHP